MANKQAGYALLRLQILQQMQHGGSDRRIKRADGLVTGNEVRIGNYCTGNSRPLTLTAGKLIGIFVKQ